MTRTPLTVLLAAAAMEDGARLLDRSLQTGAVELQELTAAVERNSGRIGLADARKWLAVAADDTESAAERVLVGLLRDAQIEGWVLQHPFEGWRLDFAWPEFKVAVEIDGWAFHSSLDSFRNDRRKGNALEAAGWARLSFTWHDLDEDPIGCIEQITAILNARRMELGC